MFVQKFMAEGYKVLAMAPNADELIAKLLENNQDESQTKLNVKVLPWDLPRQSMLVRGWFRIKSQLGILRRYLWQKSQEVHVDPELNYLEPKEFARRVMFGMNQTTWKPSFVLNMYMDLYRTDYKRWTYADEHASFIWGGIRFIPSPDMSEPYYRISSLRGMLLLDQKLVSHYQGLRSDKTFGYLPDVTDASLPDQTSEIAQEILYAAKSRKIVFMGGTISRTKNLAKWLEVIQLASKQDWYFVQIGEIVEESLNTADAHALNIIKHEKPENLFLKMEYLADERIFNDIIRHSDILFAVYRDFPNSSNMLGKAAAFEKPIVVADNHLMGRRVVQYQIGLGVSQDEPTTMLAALLQLVTNAPTRDCFRRYLHDFSHQALNKRLFDFVDTCTQSKSKGVAP